MLGHSLTSGRIADLVCVLSCVVPGSISMVNMSGIDFVYVPRLRGMSTK